MAADPAVIKWVVEQQLQLNPASALVGVGTGHEQMTSIESEIGKIEKTMKENRTAYFKDEKMQARYRDLLEAREKIKPR